MISSIVNYIKNPVWVESSEEEKIALHLLKPARFLFNNFDSPSIDERQKLKGKKIEYIPSLTDQEIKSFSFLPLAKKMTRIFFMTLAFFAALPLTPLGLLFHHMALKKSEEVKNAYDEIEKWKKYPYFISAMKGNFESLLDIPKEKESILFDETPTEYSIFNAMAMSPFDGILRRQFLLKLIYHCPERHLDKLYVESDSGGTNPSFILKEGMAPSQRYLLEALIDKCPKDKVDAYLRTPFLQSDHNLFVWLIRNNHLDLLLKLLNKYEGKMEPCFKEVFKGKDLIDIALENDASKDILKRLIKFCPTESLKKFYLNADTSKKGSFLSKSLNKSQIDIIELLIENCPKDKVQDYLIAPCIEKDETLISWMIENNHEKLLSKLISKCEGNIKPIFQHIKGKSLLDIAIKKGFTHLEIVKVMINACPKECLDLLFSPETNPMLWNQTFKGILQNKIEEILSEDPESLKKCLTAIQSDQDTLLHRANQREFFKPYLEMISLDIRKVLNADGLSPMDFMEYTFNQKWLAKPKFSSSHHQVLSKDAYSQKVKSLKKEILKLWDALVFGTQPNNISPKLLFLSLDHVSGLKISKQVTPQNLRSKLVIILDKIENKTPWLGTPPEDELADLHLFYCEMLLNFESVLTYLKELNKSEITAAYLIDIAKVDLEGRCAMGYQEEIEQKVSLSSPESEHMTFDTLLEKAVVKALRASIEHYLRTSSSKSQSKQLVHYSRQLNHVCGLTKTADPLDRSTQKQKQQLRESLTAKFNLKTFLEDVSRNIEKEVLIDSLKNQTPKIKPYSFFEKVSHFCFGFKATSKNTDELYRKAVLTAKENEDRLRIWANYEINQIAKKNTSALLESVQRVKSIVLPEISTGDNILLKIISEENETLKKIAKCEELTIGKYFNSEHSNFTEVEEAVIFFLKEKTKLNPIVKMNIHKQFILLSKRMETAREFARIAIENTQKKGALEKMITIQKNYQSKLLNIVKELESQNANDELDLSFDQKSYLYPSQAIENNYKMWMSEEDLPYKGRMILKLLNNAGILEKKK